MTNAPRSDFAGVNAAALPCQSAICSRHLPGGCRMAMVWLAKNSSRRNRRGGSLEINLKSGRRPDFATGDEGGSPNSLVAHIAATARVYCGGLVAPKFGREPMGGAYDR